MHLPVTHSEFSTLMEVTSSEALNSIAVAVSGGRDSMALALLAHHWAETRHVPMIAFICDHGLRPESAEEAKTVQRQLLYHDIVAEILTLNVSRKGNVQASAREARYGAMLQRMREEKYKCLLVGHHRHDQAETIAIRMARGSGDYGLAGMQPVQAAEDAILLRPLLPIHPGRLQATLEKAGVPWVEDPSNKDMSFKRVQVRHLLSQHPDTIDNLIRMSEEKTRLRREIDISVEGILAEADVKSHQGNTLSFKMDAFTHYKLGPRAFGKLIADVSGEAPPEEERIKRLLDHHGGTMHGTITFPGRKGRYWIAREPSAMQGSIKARKWTKWDNRFQIRTDDIPPGLMIGALGADAHLVKKVLTEPLPLRVLQVLPCYRNHGMLVSVPHLGWGLPLSAPEACGTKFS